MITKEQIQAQVECFRKGFPEMMIEAPATPGNGIEVLSPEEASRAAAYADTAQVRGRCKFVPASGAASRMFKDIFAAKAALEEGGNLPEGSPGDRLCRSIKDFAFYTPELFPDSASGLDIVSRVLTDEGLGYGSKPKGVILFHRYPSEVRTALAEHLVEAQEYMRNPDGSCNLTVTISPEHLHLFKSVLDEILPEYEKRYGVRYNVVFTYQDPETDTIAVTPDNEPFLNEDGTILRRPAGHGALIGNLAAVDAELVSIKNIDNVAHEKLLPVTAHWKKVLMGKALMLRDTIFAFQDALETEGKSKAIFDEIEAFYRDTLCVRLPEGLEGADREATLEALLNRPVRVCGMVRNEGEPGGGPFIIKGRDGKTSLQILESVQIAPKYAGLLKEATHFNPVDLVCIIKDRKGRKYPLQDYVDSQAGFISSKSYKGRELKALELPGLWNGAMSDWNTLFVEVAPETFNPVKTVLDLLRPAHRG